MGLPQMREPAAYGPGGAQSRSCQAISAIMPVHLARLARRKLKLDRFQSISTHLNSWRKKLKEHNAFARMGPTH